MKSSSWVAVYLRSRKGANGDGDGPILNPGIPTYTTGPSVIGNINKGGLGDRTHGSGGIFRDHYVWGREGG